MRLRITFRLRKLLSSIHRFLPKRIKRLVKILLRPARKVLEALLKLTYPVYPVNPVFNNESLALDLPVTDPYQSSRYSNTHKGLRIIDPTKETILLISHEGSRTGAPILTYNLAKSFQNKYNIVFIVLYPGGAGSIWEYFFEEGCFVAGPGARENYELAENIVENLVKSFNFKFAIANSAETYLVLPFLVKHHIPVISLIHEFASIYKST
ncbi:MAG: hypothetical protein ABI761_07600, partial [Saprospiraceae bacterium]